MEGAAMNEKTAYKWLKEAVMTQPGARIDRLENLVSEGMPDVNCCVCGTESWIEIKAPTEPKRASTPLFGSNHKVSQEQKNWMLRQKKASGHCYLFIVTDKGKRMLLDGKHADNANDLTLHEIMTMSNWCACGAASAEEKNNLVNALISGF